MTVSSTPRVSGAVLRVARKKGDRFYAKYRVDGRQFKRLIGPAWSRSGRPPAGYYTPRMAEEALQAILTDARRGALAEPIHRGLTFGKACEEWLRYVEVDKARAPTTLTDYRRTVNNHLVPEFGADTPIGLITSDQIDAFRDKLLAESRLTRPSIRKILVLLNGIFKRALYRRWIESNPCARTERVAVPRSGEFNVLTIEEVHATLRATSSAQDVAIFATAAFAGLRMGELRALRWRDLDFLGRSIHVRANYTHGREGRPKSGKVRSVPLISYVATALDGLGKREAHTGPADLVFCTDAGTYVHEGALRRRFYEALKRADLGHKRNGPNPMTFHDLRHTFGTMAVKVWDLSKVQGYMGHADIGTTMLYIHHMPKTTDADALNRLVLGDVGGDGLRIALSVS